MNSLEEKIEQWKKAIVGRKVKVKTERIALFDKDLQQEYTEATKNVIGKIGTIIDAKFYALEGLQDITVEYADGDRIETNLHVFDFVE